MECDDCIDRFGEMARQVIRQHQSGHEESHNVEDDGMNCPNCGSTEVRPSHRIVTDWAKLLFLRAPFRCRHCYARFWRWVWKT